MIVQELWRYPVKSVGGEQLDRAEVLPTGIDGDRRWGIVDDETGHVLTARREPRLLFAAARLVTPDEVAITLPDGRVTNDSAVLSDWLQKPVHLARAGDRGGTYENPMDVEAEADWVEWQGPAEAWHDSANARLSLVSTTTIGDWDVRRFRPNVVVEGADEDGLAGAQVTIGSARLDITARVSRCIMVTRPQPGLEADLGVLRTINRERGGALSIGALVATAGQIAVGDALAVQPAR